MHNWMADLQRCPCRIPAGTLGPTGGGMHSPGATRKHPFQMLHPAVADEEAEMNPNPNRPIRFLRRHRPTLARSAKLLAPALLPAWEAVKVGA